MDWFSKNILNCVKNLENNTLTEMFHFTIVENCNHEKRKRYNNLTKEYSLNEYKKNVNVLQKKITGFENVVHSHFNMVIML